MDQVKKYEQRLNYELGKYPIFGELEKRVNLPKSYLAIGFVSFYFVLVYLNVGGIGQFLANLASVIIPGYYSLVALETAGKGDDTQFLTYWVVYAFFTIIETWSGFIVFWIPAYWLFKTLLFLWLGLPSFSGARYVYSSVIQPFSRKFLGIKPSPASAVENEAKQAFTSSSFTQ